MSKRKWVKEAYNCGRKRMHTRPEAERQKIARESAGQKAEVYKCDKCQMYHTTTMKKNKLTPFSKIWRTLND